MSKHAEVARATELVVAMMGWNKDFNNRLVLTLMKIKEPVAEADRIIKAARRKKMSADETCRYVFSALQQSAREGG